MKYEMMAYEGMALQYYYLENYDNHLELAHQCYERFVRGLREHKYSTLRKVYSII